MGLHPTFKYDKDKEVNNERIIKIYSSSIIYKELMLKESILLENRIKEIKTTNVKSISVREYNKLNKELYTINKNIEEIEERILAFHIVFNNIDIGTSH